MKDTVAIEMVWIEVDGVAFRSINERPYYAQGMYCLKNQVARLEGYKFLTEWTITDLSTKKVLASSKPISPETQALELYEVHKSYAKVARILGVHPTTARKWCNK
jgi:hypothetical protein